MPTEVEEVIAAHPAVYEVAVYAAPDPLWGESVEAAVVLRPGAQVAAGELIELCRERLASFKKPKRIVFVGSIPRTSGARWTSGRCGSKQPRRPDRSPGAKGRGRRMTRAVHGVVDISALDAASAFGRVCRPEDVAGVVAFLVGPAAGYVTGQRIAVDGGSERSNRVAAPAR